MEWIIKCFTTPKYEMTGAMECGQFLVIIPIIALVAFIIWKIASKFE